ncbi:MAG: hypothetical protein ACJ746_23580 [Bryobacteraceae bacterium]
MAAVQPIRRQSFEAIYELLRTSLLGRKPVSANYNGKRRLFCPHVLGRNKENLPCALCYQFGGESNSGLRDKGSPDNWRCLCIEKLTDVELIDGRWRTPDGHSRPQACIVTVEYDSENPDLSRWNTKPTGAGS